MRTGISSISSLDPARRLPSHASSYEKSKASFTTPDNGPSLRCTTATESVERRGSSCSKPSMMLSAIESSCIRDPLGLHALDLYVPLDVSPIHHESRRNHDCCRDSSNFKHVHENKPLAFSGDRSLVRLL